MMQDEYRRIQATLRNTKTSQVLSTIALTTCVGSSLYIGVTKEYKDIVRVLIPISICTGVASTVSGSTAKEMEELLKDWQDIGDQQTTNRRYHQLEPTNTYELPAYTLRPFNWQLLATQKDSYPHIQIVTKSGGGKSTLAEYLCDLLGGITIAVAPHYEVGDYPTATCIVGSGRDLSTSSPDTNYTLADIISSKVQVGVAEFISVLIKEMNYRYQIDPHTGHRRGGEPVNVILDEYPSYANLVSSDVKLLLQEARKIGVRLIIITQSDLGDALQLSTQERANLTSIQLGNKAIEQVNYLYNQCKSGTPEQEQKYQLKEAVSNSKRPCIIDNQWGEIPEVVRV